MRQIWRLFAAFGCAAWLMISPAMAGDLTILHMNDHHSHLQADDGVDLRLAGQTTRVRSGGFPALIAKAKALSAGRDDVLKLHAGDAITGDLYYTLFKGAADAALMNELCFDAFALGNHEFDDGDAGLASFLDELAKGDCNTIVLAANVMPEIGVSPLTRQSATDYFRPSHIFTRNGLQIGVVGIDIACKTKQSSSPDETTLFADEFITAQAEIEKLQSQGIEQIILLTHYQYANDIALAQKLQGVDVIIGGDSHTLLGDFAALGRQSSGPYPTLVTNGDGDITCVAQAWQYAQILGELTVSFDEARQAILAAIEAHPHLSLVEEDEAAAARLAAFAGQVEGLKAQIIGHISEPLCLERIPGQGKSEICDAAATAMHGSDISNLVAHAFRDMSRTGDIAIQNGGGVRTDVPEGPFSIGDAYQLLPFANTLVAMHMTGAELHQVLEEALDYALTPDGSTGAYPYAAGLRWEIDSSKPKGQRITQLEFKGPEDTVWTTLDRARTYEVITNNYIAGGRDGYVTFKTVADEGRLVDTYLDYAQSFVDYVQETGRLKKLPISDYSTQRYR